MSKPIYETKKAKPNSMKGKTLKSKEDSRKFKQVKPIQQESSKREFKKTKQIKHGQNKSIKKKFLTLPPLIFENERTFEKG